MCWQQISRQFLSITGATSILIASESWNIVFFSFCWSWYWKYFYLSLPPPPLPAFAPASDILFTSSLIVLIASVPMSASVCNWSPYSQTQLPGLCQAVLGLSPSLCYFTRKSVPCSQSLPLWGTCPRQAAHSGFATDSVWEPAMPSSLGWRWWLVDSVLTIRWK